MLITDITIISLTLLSSLLGASRGFVKEFLSITKWIISGYITFITFEKAKNIYEEILKDSPILDFIAGGSVFILCFLILSIFFNFLSKIINLHSLGFTDKLLGLIFGFLRIILIFSLTFILYENIFFNHDKPSWMINSFSIEYIEKLSEYLENKLPEINLKIDMIT